MAREEPQVAGERANQDLDQSHGDACSDADECGNEGERDPDRRHEVDVAHVRSVMRKAPTSIR